jgi:uncharacterized protein (DUF58 family)
MLTPRGGRFLLCAVTVLVVGVLMAPRGGGTLTALGATLVVWFYANWFWFARQACGQLPRVQVERTILCDERPAQVLFVGRPLTIRLRITLPGGAPAVFVRVRDLVPPLLGVPADAVQRVVSLQPNEPFEWTYTARAQSPGVVRFAGVGVQVFDIHGLFAAEVCVRDPDVRLPVLPPLSEHDAVRRGHKRHNQLPPPGVHRLRRPGSGSELLDLRDYRPGDPPKMIAWKPSARRDKLITKEFENEVPLRCTLFLDCSASQRLGVLGQTPLARHAEVLAAIAQAALGERDLVGLTLCTEDGTHSLPPARDRAQRQTILQALAEAAALTPTVSAADVPVLLPAAANLARQVYPDLLLSPANRLPWWLYWRPLLGSWLRWLVFALLTPLVLIALLVASVGANLLQVDAPEQWITLGVLAGGPALAGVALWVLYGLSGYWPSRAKAISQRKQLAAVCAAVQRRGPAQLAQMHLDDAVLAPALGQLLADFAQPVPVRHFDASGAARFAGTQQLTTLATALTRAVARSRDNELFVLLVDCFPHADALAPLLQAIQVARARHHEVIVLCPWQDGVPIPDRRNPGKSLLAGLDKLSPLQIDMQTQWFRLYQAGAEHARRAFAKLGVVAVTLGSADAVELVLLRLRKMQGRLA